MSRDNPNECWTCPRRRFGVDERGMGVVICCETDKPIGKPDAATIQRQNIPDANNPEAYFSKCRSCGQ